MQLLVGLGNPGREYERHRHNIGFMALDLIHGRYGFAPYRRKYQGDYTEATINGEKVALLKPMTFMNESGKSVAEATRFYKVTPANIIVFHDELDLAPFRLRVKTGGGNGGHNGLRSIDAWLGNPNYRRVRLGIGHPGNKDRVTGYVLGGFSKDEAEPLEKFLDVVCKETTLLLQGRDEDFMTRVARATPSLKAAIEKKDLENGI